MVKYNSFTNEGHRKTGSINTGYIDETSADLQSSSGSAMIDGRHGITVQSQSRGQVAAFASANGWVMCM